MKYQILSKSEMKVESENWLKMFSKLNYDHIKADLKTTNDNKLVKLERPRLHLAAYIVFYKAFLDKSGYFIVIYKVLLDWIAGMFNPDCIWGLRLPVLWTAALDY